nr:retrotransposon protein, putative, Ty1-copia subclass [Tanacetum cinerariifolium]
AINLINRSLNNDFGDFVRNFNMHCMGKTVTELHALLIDYEKGLKDKAPTPQVLTIQNGRENKPKPKANKKDKSKDLSPLPRSWTLERNCPLYLKELRKNKDIAEHGAAALDYLSKNGIVQHLTSPYTPQQNGISERRNHALLDMVRSMFNLMTLPLSFWDYALESAVCILNMVPTKKVDKTPYEIWHSKAPNLSYLKVWCCEAYAKRDLANKLHQ